MKSKGFSQALECLHQMWANILTIGHMRTLLESLTLKICVAPVIVISKGFLLEGGISQIGHNDGEKFCHNAL